jgi:hypothetical protein
VNLISVRRRKMAIIIKQSDSARTSENNIISKCYLSIRISNKYLFQITDAD